MGARIAVVGSSNMDLVTYVTRMPEAGETLEAPSFAMGFGGKGANQAVAAARLGAAVVMVSKVGDDAFADATLDNFAANGIDARHVGRAPGVSSGVAPIFVEPSGENRILIVQGANALLTPADVDAAAADIAACRLLLLQLEVPVPTVLHAIAVARARGVPVLLNPAPATAHLDAALLRDVDFLVPNESELALLTGQPVRSPADAEAAARRLIAQGTRTVIVTMGSRGALLVEAGGSRPIPPVPTEAVDTTGAGDAFIGAFACFYAETADIPASLSRAAAYAAQSITRRGTQSSYPTRAAFDAAGG